MPYDLRLLTAISRAKFAGLTHLHAALVAEFRAQYFREYPFSK